MEAASTADGAFTGREGGAGAGNWGRERRSRFRVGSSNHGGRRHHRQVGLVEDGRVRRGGKVAAIWTAPFSRIDAGTRAHLILCRIVDAPAGGLVALEEAGKRGLGRHSWPFRFFM